MCSVELQEAVRNSQVAIDTIWVLVTAFLVMFMQAGFAMLESGLTRSKNTGNIVMKNLLDFCVGSLVFWAVGFAVMFGRGNGFLGFSGFFLEGDFAHLGLSIPIAAFLLFQTVFAGTAATIVSGAMAERTKFTSYLVYSAAITAIIYPVVGHWAWGGGWLSQLGFKDFAGSTVVHSVGGWAALAGAMILGPRIGKYNPDGSRNTIAGHNLMVAALGVFILWFGWFGFNPGSTLSGLNTGIAHIALNTNLAAAAGALGGLVSAWLLYRRADVGMTLNGVVAGLVGITAGCAFVSPGGAVLIGLLSGVVAVLVVELLERWHVDDPVGAIAAHAGAGVFGTLMVGLLDLETGLLYGGGWRQLGVQLLGVIATFLWTFGTAYVLFSLLKATIGLRVSPQDEERGLDLGEHGAPAYGEVGVALGQPRPVQAPAGGK